MIQLDVMYLADRKIGLRKAALDVVLFVLPESCLGLQEDFGGRYCINVVDSFTSLPQCRLSI